MRTPPLIALEEHFLATAIADSDIDKYVEQLKHIPGLMDKLLDLSDLRTSQMDSGHVSLQIVSHCAGAKTAAQCRSANDQLYAATQKHPDRIAGFATLDITDPASAADELRRCVADLHFPGALIDAHTPDGKYFDDPSYDVLWSTAVDLGVPVYIHPTWASNTVLDALYRGPTVPEAATLSIAHSGFGWHADTATHFLRLFAAGVFDRFPTLQIVLGHFGEMIPFMFTRICRLSRRWATTYRRDFATVWRENVWVTTSGVWGMEAMVAVLKTTGVDRIMFSLDYPFASSEDGLKWWRELESSGLVDEEGLWAIGCGNAQRLLGVKTVKTF